MKVLVLLLVLVAIVSGSDDVDESILVPHAVDASETSDREILESLNEDEETTEVTTLKPTTTTTTTTTVATTTTTTAKPTEPPKPTFRPGTISFLRSLRLNIPKMYAAGLTERAALRYAQRIVRRRALQRAKAELLNEQRLANRERARKEELEKERLAEIARKKAEDYIPASLKSIMTGVGLDFHAAEEKHESVQEIKKDVGKKVAEEEAKITAQANADAKKVTDEIEKELKNGLKEPLAKEAALKKEQEKKAKEAIRIQEDGFATEAGVVESVKNKEVEISTKLTELEKQIIREAMHDKQVAEQKALKEAQEVREKGKAKLARIETQIRSSATKATKEAEAAEHFLDEQELPRVNKFIAFERRKLESRLSDIETEAKYKNLRLKKMLETLD